MLPLRFLMSLDAPAPGEYVPVVELVVEAESPADAWARVDALTASHACGGLVPGPYPHVDVDEVLRRGPQYARNAAQQRLARAVSFDVFAGAVRAFPPVQVPGQLALL